MSVFKLNTLKLLSLCVIISFILMCIINILPFSFGSCKCADCTSTISSRNDAIISKYYDSVVENTSGKKKLAIIVPFRDRFDELLKFVPHMTKFLNNQQIPHHIFIINQIDRFRFNRASLINVGFLYTKENFDYIAMHDVDLLPLNENLKYDCPIDGPFHIAAPGLHPKYNYPTFIGGILLLKNEHFEMVNGMSNKYWGWGLEDDEFYVRLKDVKLKVYRPQNILTGSSDTFNHIHDRAHRRRDTTKCFNQKEETRKRDTKTGLNTIKYEIKNRNELSIDGIKVTILNVDLKCDKNSTPWCDCSNQESSKPMPRKGLRKKK